VEISAEISLKYDVVISCIFMSAERYATGQNPLIINVHRSICMNSDQYSLLQKKLMAEDDFDANRKGGGIHGICKESAWLYTLEMS